MSKKSQNRTVAEAPIKKEEKSKVITLLLKMELAIIHWVLTLVGMPFSNCQETIV